MATTYISPSKLKSFRLCPKRQALEPYQKSDAKDFGTAFHLGAQALCLGATVEDAVKAAGFSAEDADRGRLALEAVEDHPAVDLPSIRENLITVESSDGEACYYGNRMAEVAIVPGVWGIRCRMDLVDVRPKNGALRILDWKSGQTEEADDLQLAMNTLAAWKKYPGFTAIETAFFYAEKNWYQPFHWNETSLVAALDLVDRLAREFLACQASGVYPERLNKYCTYCTLRDGCATYRSAIVTAPTPAEYEIQATVENLPRILDAIEKFDVVAKAAASVSDALKSARNQVLLDFGPVTVNGITHTAKKVAGRYEYNTPALLSDATRVLGEMPISCLTFSSSAFEDLVVKLPRAEKEKKAELRDILKRNRTLKSETVRVSSAIAKTVDELPDGEEVTQE